jgi:hypothetical protein
MNINLYDNKIVYFFNGKEFIANIYNKNLLKNKNHNNNIEYNTSQIKRMDFYYTNEIEISSIISNISFSFLYFHTHISNKEVKLREVSDENEEIFEDYLYNNIIQNNRYFLLLYKNYKYNISQFISIIHNPNKIIIYKLYWREYLQNAIDLLNSKNIVIVNLDILCNINYNCVISNFSQSFILDKDISNEKKNILNKYIFTQDIHNENIHNKDKQINNNMPPEYHLLCYINLYNIETLSRINIIDFIDIYSQKSTLVVNNADKFIEKYTKTGFKEIIKTANQWNYIQIQNLLK